MASSSTVIKRLLRLCRISKIGDDAGRYPVQQVSYLGKQGDALIWLPYGVHANIPPDKLAVMLALHGNAEARVALPGSPTDRPASLAEGEVAFYHPPTGSIIHFKANGDIEVTSIKTVKVDAAEDVDVDAAGDVTVDAGGKVNAVAGTTITLDAAGLITINAGAGLDVNVTGNADVTATGDVTVEATGSGDVEVKANSGDVTVESTSGIVNLGGTGGKAVVRVLDVDDGGDQHNTGSSKVFAVD